jgi:GTPase SAR1 family protein
VGNKIDLDSERQVSYEEGMDYALNNNMLFYESSAKTGINIENIFTETATLIVKKIQITQEKDKYTYNENNTKIEDFSGIKKGMKLSKKNQSQKTRCCV